ncbi:MAG TPA: glycosyltransferase [Baekduia sp.]|nr:glycosyltransferase [Baekduia sp.]
MTGTAGDMRTAVPGDGRPRVDGKLLAVGQSRLWPRGVTYGPFAAEDDDIDRARVIRDFDAMRAAGINAIRTYSVPQRWMLDLAAERGIWVLVGLAWEQHIAFLDDRRRAADLISRTRQSAASVAGHRALLAFVIGNEIPASIVRWHGRRRIERFLGRMCAAVRAADPGALVTYAGYPSTEYLRLPFLDFAAFNVYLEDPAELREYLARLQNIAGERPLIVTEIGLDSRRNGTTAQAASLYAQIRSCFRAGAGGAFAFAWTDEWHRGGEEILDWDFGLTDRGARPKPALDAVRSAYAGVPAVDERAQPSFSVVVCTRNGAATLDECLAGVGRLTYPDYEVIVVDDGSTDASPEIAAHHGATVISTKANGLSAARNAGLSAASGEFVAFIDDDAAPDPDWLTFLSIAFEDSGHAAVGGPNLPFAEDGAVAACVANSPGGPQHVLLTDELAEHIPGCNMAFRRVALRAVGGFDEQFVRAGDDVDICWRLQGRGMTIGFHPAAVVWHHRRPSVRRYLDQQRGYGAAEAMLERKWPEKYNAIGQPRWHGRLYAPSAVSRLSRSRVYYGVWGLGAFQPDVGHRGSRLISIGGTPELNLLAGMLVALTAGSAVWSELRLAALPLMVVAGILVGHALLGASAARFVGIDRRPSRYALTVGLHLLQPVARLRGRLENGLSPWRRPRHAASLGLPGTMSVWLEAWRPVEDRLKQVETTLRSKGFVVRRGDEFSRWEFEVTAGALAGVRIRLVAEEHGRGKQLVRTRVRPSPSPWQCGFAAVLTALAIWAFADGALIAAGLLGLSALIAAAAITGGCVLAAGSSRDAVAALRHQPAFSIVRPAAPGAPEARSAGGGEDEEPGKSIAAAAGARR